MNVISIVFISMMFLAMLFTMVNATPNLNFTDTTTIDYHALNVTVTEIFPGFSVPRFLLDIIGIIVFVLSLFTIHHDDVVPAVICMAFLYVISVWEFTFIAFAGICTAILIADEFGKIKMSVGIP